MMTQQDFTRLLNEKGPGLVLYARQWTSAPEDVVQEAFLKLLAQGRQPDALVPWLYKVVRHAAIDRSRSDQRRNQREIAVARPERWFVEAEVNGIDADAAVAALEQLPADQREVLVARLWGGLSFEEIGTIADCSASTAFRRHEAGLAALRKVLGVPCPTLYPPV